MVHWLYTLMLRHLILFVLYLYQIVIKQIIFYSIIKQTFFNTLYNNNDTRIIKMAFIMEWETFASREPK